MYTVCLFFGVRTGVDEFISLVEDVEALFVGPLSRPNPGWSKHSNTGLNGIDDNPLFDPITSWALLVPEEGVCVSSLPTSGADLLDDRGSEAIRWSLSRVLELFGPSRNSGRMTKDKAEYATTSYQLISKTIEAVPSAGCVLMKDENPFFLRKCSIRNGKAQCLLVVVGKSDATLREVQEAASTLVVFVGEQI